MINKKFLLFAFSLILVASSIQTIAITYPSKKTLQKVDHGISLATTAAVIVGLANKKNVLGSASLYAAFALMGANIIVNGMAMKYEKKSVSALKASLPMAGWLGALLAARGNNKTGSKILIATWMVNGIKNIWDIYSLMRPEESESSQHD